MAETVFWDTSAFVALGNADDELHEAAVAVSGELACERARILTTDAVLTEVVNMFSRSAFRSMAGQIISAFQESANPALPGPFKLTSACGGVAGNCSWSGLTRTGASPTVSVSS